MKLDDDESLSESESTSSSQPSIPADRGELRDRPTGPSGSTSPSTVVKRFVPVAVRTDAAAASSSSAKTSGNSHGAIPGRNTGATLQTVSLRTAAAAPPSLASSSSSSFVPQLFALHAAVRKHSLPEVKKLLEKGEPVDRVDDAGQTALHLAAQEGQAEIVKQLLKAGRGGRGQEGDREGLTPLHHAVLAGDCKSFELLLRAGASTRAVTRAGNTVLHAVCLTRRWKRKELACVKLLLAKGWSEINALNNEQLTALQLACQRGLYDAVVLMLKARADPTIYSGGEPVLFSALYAENPGLVQVLLQAGADVSQFNSAGQSLMEVVNPKCEIYRIIKRFMLSRPGGERKLNLVSEDASVATRVAELPPDFKRMIQASGLAHEEIEAHWEVFCSVMHFVGKRRIFATEEEAQRARERIKAANTTSAVSEQTRQLEKELFVPGNPKTLYKKLRVAGKGGFGMVFSGIGPDKRPVAIKRLPHTSERDRQQNLLEARFLKRCSHPNIAMYLRTHECPDDRELWILMEMIDGGTVDEALDPDAQASFAEPHIAYFCREMLSGIRYLHNNYIAHRDLKAPNIMISLEGDVKLIDFGLAVDLSKTGNRTEMVGSPYWIPPEMILRRPHAYPVDIWSMAVCVLALANRHPPNYGSPLRCMFSVGIRKPPGLDQPSRWSEEFRVFLSRMLVPEPEQRGTAEQLLQDRFLSKCARKDEIRQLVKNVFITHKLQQTVVI